MKVASSTSRSWYVTLILLGVSVLLATAAVVTGIDDNPPGILLAFLAALALMLAIVHPWRTARKFLSLLLAAIIILALFILMNILLDTTSLLPTALRDFLNSPVGEGLSMVIIILCPTAFVVGAVGSIIMSIRNRRSSL